MGCQDCQPLECWDNAQLLLLRGMPDWLDLSWKVVQDCQRYEMKQNRFLWIMWKEIQKIQMKRRWRIFLLFHYSIIIMSYLTTFLCHAQPIPLPLSFKLFLLRTFTVICWLWPTTPYTLSMFARGWHSNLQVQKKRGKGWVFGQRVILQAFWRRAALWFKSLPVQLLSERNRAEQHLNEWNR